MRASLCRTLALLSPALLAPVLSRASFGPFHQTDNDIEERAIAGAPESSTNVPSTESTFHVLARDGDDDALEFKFEIYKPSQPVSCGHSNILVNGYALEHQWTGTDLDTTGSGKTLLIAPNARTRDLHSLEVSSKAHCVAPSAAASPKTSSEEDKPNAVGVIHFQIDKVDDNPASPEIGLTISFDQATRRIISGVASPSAGIDELSIQDTRSQSTSIEEEASDQSIGFEPTLDDEIKELNSLEEDLDRLKKLIRQKKKHVNHLTKEKFTGLKHKFRGCESIKCVAQKLYRKAKNCLRTIALRFGPKGLSKSLQTDRYCEKMHPGEKMDNATSGKGHCSHYIGQAHQGQKEFHSAQSGKEPIDQHHHLHLDEHDDDDDHSVIAIVGILASVLCLSCFGISIHRRCCNPRARAERAARREERRTRRQYRRLARRKAVKDWWDRVVRRKVVATGDYEEKRSLILAQESILEDEMQGHIRRLCHGERRTDDTIAAEEGRAPSRRGSETLPEYRSRTNSGSPPSYREVDGTSVFTPSGTTTTTIVTEDSDCTPDSSVANLSPRHSSDTLRTERSLV